jgi:hypothetical protein
MCNFPHSAVTAPLLGLQIASAPHSRTTSAHYNCALLGCYAASSGNVLPTFRDNLSVPPSAVEITTTSCVTTQKSAVLIHFAAEARDHAPLVYVFPIILRPGFTPIQNKEATALPVLMSILFYSKRTDKLFGMCKQSAVVVRTFGLD